MNEPIQIQQPNTPQLDHKSFMVRHVLAEAFATLVVVAMIAGAYYYQTSNIDSVFVAPVHHAQNATADWKTYTDSQYGFEFKYPVDWLFDNNKPTSDTGNLFSLTKYGPTQTSQSLSFDDGIIITAGITSEDGMVLDFSNKKISLDKWVESEISPFGGDKVDEVAIATNGFVGKIRLAYNKDDLINPWGEAGGIYKLLPSGHALLISWERMNVKNDLSYEKYFLPILSTFKFTDSGDPLTASWKTFTNTKYNFQLTYPSGWSTTMVQNTLTVKSGENCYVTLLFGGTVSPQNYKYNNYAEAAQGQICDESLNQILATYKSTSQ